MLNHTRGGRSTERAQQLGHTELQVLVWSGNRQLLEAQVLFRSNSFKAAFNTFMNIFIALTRYTEGSLFLPRPVPVCLKVVGFEVRRREEGNRCALTKDVTCG